jgi:hypothetical protein
MFCEHANKETKPKVQECDNRERRCCKQRLFLWSAEIKNRAIASDQGSLSILIFRVIDSQRSPLAQGICRAEIGLGPHRPEELPNVCYHQFGLLPERKISAMTQFGVVDKIVVALQRPVHLG